MGIKETFQSAVSVAEDLLFDFRYKFDTAKVLEVKDLDISSEDKQHSVRYKPTRVRYFRKLMQAVALPKSATFVDVGCGKGRILMLAAKYGFQRTIGLELSPQLCKVAESNLETYCNHHPEVKKPSVICTNVLEHQLTDDETIFFLFWPFDREVTVLFLDLLKQSLLRNPRELWLIINEFQFPDLLESDTQFERTHLVKYGASEFHVFHTTPQT